MADPISFHYSFIVRCWRDAGGALRGWVIDVLSQHSYPFATPDEMIICIENLTRETQADKSPNADTEKDEAPR
jgi:hypothetical protein